MSDFLNALVVFANYVLVPGIAYGSQIALGALGVTLIFGVLRFANFAYGELMAFGTMITILITWWMQSLGISISPFPTALLALPFGIAAAITMCLATDRFVFRFYRVNKSATIILVMASVGVMFVYSGLTRFVIGAGDERFADGARFLVTAKEFQDLTGLTEGLAVRLPSVITVFITLIVAVWLLWFLHRTRVGKAMRAFSDNEDLALLSGINPDRIVALTWIIAGSLAVIAGTLYGLDKSFRPFTYAQLLLPIFAATIVGGIGQPMGAIAGGYLVAFSEVTVTYAFKRVAEALGFEPEGLLQLLSVEYKFAVSFVILVAVLLLRPSGIVRGKVF
ncbi:branched-chain amino acid ABC transporter permease [Brucella gallinifaecis]|uniref:branched-chain amino acid ABC transporter permease n=1 Tax=Brucella gallinifaecis TaxID=215590 RepID=UPI00235EE326|nr:branched-chain amino acid ABC transporter permease [Brucella gallinifaecis]